MPALSNGQRTAGMGSKLDVSQVAKSVLAHEIWLETAGVVAKQFVEYELRTIWLTFPS